MSRCRHNSNSWLICGARYDWCWKCGAIRRLEVDGGICWPVTEWMRPVGPDGKNPWPMKEINRSKK